MNNLAIRLETEKDYRAVEELTREAFWNVYVPGASEHYFVHTMRKYMSIIKWQMKPCYSKILLKMIL